MKKEVVVVLGAKSATIVSAPASILCIKVAFNVQYIHGISVPYPHTPNNINIIYTYRNRIEFRERKKERGEEREERKKLY